MYSGLNRTVGSGARRMRAWLGSLALALAGTLALVAGCGGGVGTEGTGAFASGPITGFGSIVVNGIHFDEINARVEDETGAPSERSLLKLGMVVEVEAGTVSTDSNGSRATATRVRFASELAGRVDAVDPAAGAFTVLGKTVQMGAGTAFDSDFGGGPDKITIGTEVEVYGLPGATAGTVVATRIELRSAGGPRKIRGIVSALDIQAHTFSIGSELFVYSTNTTGIPAKLADGIFVRLQLQNARDGQGRWVVTAFYDATPKPGDQARVEVEGVVTAFTSATSFSVNGVPVDASGVTPEGGTPALGLRVEVEGAFSSGVLVAQRVKVESEDETSEFEFTGTIAAVDSINQTLTLQGISEIISYSRPPRIEDGELTDLPTAAGRRIEVRGVLSTDRTRVEATRIKFLS